MTYTEKNESNCTDLIIAQRLWMGSMIFEELLHAKAKRVVAEYSSMILLSACCAAGVILKNKRIRERKRQRERKSDWIRVIVYFWILA